MLLFLDIEFTCLPGLLLSTPPGAGPLNTRVCQEAKPISLAMASEDGKHSFYGEIERGKHWDWTDCSDFVMTDVLQWRRVKQRLG